MKILFIVHRIPYPPNKGDKIRSFFILKHLAQKHEIYLTCLIDDKHDLQYVENLSKYCKGMEFSLINKTWANFRMLFNLLSGKSLSLAYFGSGKLHKKVKYWLKTINFDAIYVYSSGVAQYAINVKGIPKIMDYVDVDSDKWKQNAEYSKFPFNWIYHTESELLRKYEKLIVDNFEKYIFVTERDKNLFKSFIVDKDAFIIPNGVNLEYFSKNADFEDDVSLSDSGNKIVFTGAMDYFANIDAAEYFYKKIMPLIKENFKFLIVGSNPTKKLKKLSDGKAVIVTGRVKDIRPYLKCSQVYVAPLRISRGVQNKVLEAMSFGLPVVTTSKVLDGIRARPGIDLLVEDDPKSFANAVTSLLSDKSLAEKIGQAGRKFVEQNYNWSISFEMLDQLIEAKSKTQ